MTAPTSQSRRAVGALVVLGALALTSCSSGSGDAIAGSGRLGGSATSPDFPSAAATPSGATATPGSSDSASTSDSPGTGPSGSPSSGAGVPASLSRLVLTAADLPAGWAAGPHDSSDDSSPTDLTDTTFLDCVGVPDGGQGSLATAYSKDFSAGADETFGATSSADLYASHAAIVRDSKIFTSPKADACFAEQGRTGFGDGLPAGAKVGNIRVHVTPGNGGGPRSLIATLAASFEVSMSGDSATFYVDTAFFAGARTEVEIDFFGLGVRVDAATRKAAIAAVGARAATS